jgi:hypothetical protein
MIFVSWTNELMLPLFLCVVKRYSFQKEGVNLRQKKFYEINPRGKCYKTFYIRNLAIFNKLECLSLTNFSSIVQCLHVRPELT